jgi:hypothetical protein
LLSFRLRAAKSANVDPIGYSLATPTVTDALEVVAQAVLVVLGIGVGMRFRQRIRSRSYWPWGVVSSPGEPRHAGPLRYRWRLVEQGDRHEVALLRSRLNIERV